MIFPLLLGHFSAMVAGGHSFDHLARLIMGLLNHASKWSLLCPPCQAHYGTQQAEVMDSSEAPISSP
jgi:hypothetical protein